MLRVMLDTNIVIYVIKRKPMGLLDTFNEQAGYMCISAITLSELLHGVEKSSDPPRNLRRVEDFVSRLDVLDYGARAAGHYGEIKAELECKGTPIGENDFYIAAHARSEGLILVTNNVREFARVNGLRMENWLADVG